jgi:glycosyltransferase involved in cell wall biosynthesis
VPPLHPSNSVLLLDISRLIWRAQRVAPTGIDRVELAYAQHFIAGHGSIQAHAVLHLFGFVFAVSRAGARQFIEDLSTRWHGAAPKGRLDHVAAVARTYLRLLTSAWSCGRSLRRKLRSRPGPPIFLVVSNHHVSRSFTFARVRRTLGAKTVCFIHDVIPIDCPEYFPSGWEARYHRVAANVGRIFDAVIANSETTARSLRPHLVVKDGGPSSRVHVRVAPLGVRSFPRPHEPASLADRPYFVVIGTIEPRKNHLLLLNLWARLATTVEVPPRLLVIGARGWENEQVVDMLERSRRLRGLIEEHNRLADTEIGALLVHARALLAPSFTEGFGLPLCEALASGTPVICSDIPAFREVGRDTPEFLDPLDPHAWMDAVLEYSRPDSARRAAQLLRLRHWRTPTWTDHFQVVHRLLGGLDTRDDRDYAPDASRAAPAA